MDIRAFLIEEKHFEPDGGGRMQIDPPGAAVACERRRRSIKTRVSQLLDASQAPVLEEACRFAMLETFAEKKNLIHRKTDEFERTLDAGNQPLSAEELARAAVSDWDFDRIAFYLIDERRKARTAESASDLGGAVERVRMELEKARAHSGESVSQMPLKYSLGPLKVAAGDLDAVTKDEVRQVLEDVGRLIEGRDAGGQIRLAIADVHAKLSREPTADDELTN